MRFLVWRTGAVRCALPLDALREVVRTPGVVPLPGAPPAVRGLANVRGELLTVVDAGTLLGEAATGVPGELVLVRVGGRTVGLAVDEVEDLVAVGDDAVAPAAGGWTAALPSGGRARVLQLERELAPLFPA